MEELYATERRHLNHTVITERNNYSLTSIRSNNTNKSSQIDNSNVEECPPEQILQLTEINKDSSYFYKNDLNNARFIDEEELKDISSHSDMESSTVNSAEIDALMNEINRENKKSKYLIKYKRNNNKNNKNKKKKIMKINIILKIIIKR